MNTPYCTALRIGRREVDDLKVSIGVELERLTTVDIEQQRIIDAMERERQLAAENLAISSHAYFQLMQSERERLAGDRQAIDARLGQLRSKAREAYGSVRAIEQAADQYRSDAERVIEAREQSAVDDRSSVRFSLQVSLERRRSRTRAA